MYKRQENKQKVRFDSIYLGYKMKELEVNDINSIVDYLIQNKIVGLAHGRAEFGPRALGNRSLLADPKMCIRDSLHTMI